MVKELVIGCDEIDLGFMVGFGDSIIGVGAGITEEYEGL